MGTGNPSDPQLCRSLHGVIDSVSSCVHLALLCLEGLECYPFSLALRIFLLPLPLDFLHSEQRELVEPSHLELNVPHSFILHTLSCSGSLYWCKHSWNFSFVVLAGSQKITQKLILILQCPACISALLLISS